MNHRHHTQILGQMAATSIYRGYFFVFMSEPVLVELDFDVQRWISITANVKEFFFQVMAPTMLQNMSTDTSSM